jgi:protein CpxP
MKGISMNARTLAGFLFASSLALGLAPAAFAQGGPGPMQGGPGMHEGQMHGHGDMRGRGGLMRELNLTEAQQDQIFKIHHEQEPAFRDQMKKVRAARQDLHKLALAERYDEAAVRRAADAQAKAASDLAVMHAQTLHRVREILTPEQRARFEQMGQRHFGPGPR